MCLRLRIARCLGVDCIPEVLLYSARQWLSPCIYRSCQRKIATDLQHPLVTWYMISVWAVSKCSRRFARHLAQSRNRVLPVVGDLSLKRDVFYTSDFCIRRIGVLLCISLEKELRDDIE